jgi:hypothetical protein
VLGLESRHEAEMWYQVSLYGAGNIESYDDPSNRLAPVPASGKVKGGNLFDGSFLPVVGREVLRPERDTSVLARFADGGAAATCHGYGKGRAYVVGFFAGLEYSATVRRSDFDMRRDFDPNRRLAVTAPARELTRPVVDASDPLVEGVLLENATNGMRAVTLANWAYGVRAIHEDASGRRRPIIEHLPVESLQVTIKTSEKTNVVTSCILRRNLQFTRSDDAIVVEVPRLEEGDVLLLK